MDKKITALETQKRNPDRLNVYLDNEFAFGVSKFVGAWLSVGQTLSDGKALELKQRDEREKALQRALKYIAYKPRTSQEVRKKLETAEFAAETIRDVILELENKGYLNDLDYARQWVDLRSASRPRGRFLLELELKRKGISEPAINAALEDIPEEKVLARKFAQKYKRKLSCYDLDSSKKKLFAAMQRRGFTYSVSKEIAEDVLKEKNMDQ